MNPLKDKSLFKSVMWKHKIMHLYSIGLNLSKIGKKRTHY